MLACRKARWYPLTDCTIRRKATIASAGRWRVRSLPARGQSRCGASRSNERKIILAARLRRNHRPAAATAPLGDGNDMAPDSGTWPVHDRSVGAKPVDAAPYRRDLIETKRATCDQAEIVRRPLAVAHQELIVHA